MAVIPNPSRVPFGAISVFRAVSSVENVFGSISRWNRANRVEKALLSLSERQLTDIGLSRAEVSMVAKDLARRY